MVIIRQFIVLSSFCYHDWNGHLGCVMICVTSLSTRVFWRKIVLFSFLLDHLTRQYFCTMYCTAYLPVTVLCVPTMYCTAYLPVTVLCVPTMYCTAYLPVTVLCVPTMYCTAYLPVTVLCVPTMYCIMCTFSSICCALCAYPLLVIIYLLLPNLYYIDSRPKLERATLSAPLTSSKEM